jgi:pimeloyl-ACP methyl ester carboxylesterase
MLKLTLIILILVAGFTLCKGAEPDSSQVVVYLFPGQGADYRQYRDLSFPEGYDTVHISYPVPDKRESMAQFARRFIPVIDTAHPYILVGVSLGGMICTELADVLHPKKVILISSAKAAFELPGRYTFIIKIHLNRIIPKGLVKAGARTLQGIVEPDRKYDKETYKDMLKKKDAAYLKRTVDMIINWERDSYLYSIIHIHGDADHTIPIKNVDCDYVIAEGSHLVVLSRAEEISRIFTKILKEK